MSPDLNNRDVASSGMTLDTAAGPVDVVAVERVRHGFYTRLTPAEHQHLDAGLTYDAELEQLIAEGLGVKAASVNRRINRAKKRDAGWPATAP